jgi:hypothetical protein
VKPPAAVGTAAGALFLACVLVGAARPARAAGVDGCSTPDPPPQGAIGVVDPFRPPAPASTALNAEGRALYRQGKWEEARVKYRAAEAADPDFLAPALNVACSFVRQERFDDATAEVLRILDRAYLPWAREVLTATDLGALKVQPQMARVRQALADGARRWGEGVGDAVIFVARQREPLRLPAASASAPAVLVLSPHQEVFAWSPATGRYRQLTAEDGRVLAAAEAADHRTLLYVTAEKLIRSPGGGAALRGVALHTLALPAMAPGPAIPIAGDVRRLAVGASPSPTPAAAFTVALEGEGKDATGDFTLGGGPGPVTLVPPRRGRPGGRGTAWAFVLTGAGVTAGAERAAPWGRGCKLVARDRKTDAGAPFIEINGPGRKPAAIGGRYGAGLAGLALP